MNNRIPVINIYDIPLQNWQHGSRYQAQLGAIGKHVGMEKLGCRLVVLPPQKTAWPKHAHYVNEEMFHILEGTGVLYFAENSFPIKAGDIVAVPANPKTPHQIYNNSDSELKYLAISTMLEPDIVFCPDSNKTGIMAGSPPGGNKQKRSLTAYFLNASQVDYWEGED